MIAVYFQTATTDAVHRFHSVSDGVSDSEFRFYRDENDVLTGFRFAMSLRCSAVHEAGFPERKPASVLNTDTPLTDPSPCSGMDGGSVPMSLLHADHLQSSSNL